MGHFKVKSKKKLADMQIGDVVEESNFACIDQGTFIQLEYIETDESHPYIVKPGIYSIAKGMQGLELHPTSFVEEHLLKDLAKTKEIEHTIDSFFSNLDVYKELKIFPRRGMLLFGPGGSGKTSSAISVINKYIENDKSIAVILWSTDKFEANDVKSFVKRFEYEGVEKLILLAEDIGGLEMDERAPSPAGLLSLLDNKEMIFKIPIFTIATTNFPEMFLENLTNRPGRFDDKIEVGYPGAESRQKLIQFYLKDAATPDIIDLIASKKYDNFTPAHIQEILLKMKLFKLTAEQAINKIASEIELVKNSFTKKKKLGFHDEF